MSAKMFVSSPGRLSERRGIHKLAHIDPSSTSSSVPRAVSHEPTQLFDFFTSSTSSSAVFPNTGSSNSTLYATRTSSFEQPPAMSSTHECDESIWNPPTVYGTTTTQIYGWGPEYRQKAESRGRRLKSGSLSGRLQSDGSIVSPASSVVWEQCEGDCPDSPADDRDISMPPTPPSGSIDNLFCNYMSQSPILDQATAEELYDPEAFSEPSAPASPLSEPTGRFSRRNTVINKINKLRPLLKRRSSSISSQQRTPPPIPHISTMPTLYNKDRPTTPPSDFDSYFAQSVPLPHNTSVSSMEDMSRSLTATPPLPPLVSPLLASQLSSPTTVGNHPENFPDVLNFNISDPIRSPLPPAPISPLGSPAMVPLLCPTINILTPLVLSPHHHQQVVPDVVGPASPALISPSHRRKVSGDHNGLVTANVLADMIEQMQREDEAFMVTEKHFSESGWNTPEEIESIRQQRLESKADWKRRIAESKQILVDIRRSEVKKSAANASPYAFSSLAESNESIDSRMSK